MVEAGQPPETMDVSIEQRILSDTSELIQELYGIPDERATEEAERKLEGWKAEVHKAIMIAINPGRSVRYLGVWYEEDFKWKEQRRILTRKFSELNKSI